MIRIVQFYLILIALLTVSCLDEQKSDNDIPEAKLVEAYVQISLIYESERGLAEKDARVEAYLNENNLSKQKIDRMLDKYKSNPNEWRGFFMKVQSRLRELETQQREKIAAVDSIKVVETEKTIFVKTETPTIVDTIITRTADIETPQTKFDKLTAKVDSPEQEKDIVTAIFSGVNSQKIQTVKPELEDDTDDVPIPKEPEELKTEKIADEIKSIEEPKKITSDVGIGFILYKIKSGDNLSTLAKEHGSKTAQLMLVNSLANANSIKIGQTLLIPNEVTMVLLHTISSGDVLSKISSRYSSDLDLLIEINEIDDVHSIKAGDFLYVPVLKGE